MKDEEVQVCLQLSPKSGADGARMDTTPAAVVKQDNGDNEQVANELKSIRETMNKLLEAKASDNETVSAELLLMEKRALDEQVLRNQQLTADNSKLENSNERLHGEVKSLETKMASQKESFLVEKTRLESEIGASKREAQIQIQALEEARKQLAEQLKTAQQDKAATTVRVAELENEVNLAREKTQELKHDLETLRVESRRELESLALEGEMLQASNGELSRELEQVRKARDDLKSQVQEYEGALDSLENQLLPESEAQLKATLEKLRLQQEATEQAEEELKVKSALVEKLKTDIEALENEKEEERFQFQALNEESSKAFEKLRTEAVEKQDKIDTISQQLSDVQKELESEKERSQELEKEIDSIKQEMDACVEGLEQSSQALEKKLYESENEKLVLEEKLESAMNQVAGLLEEKKNTQATSDTLEEVQAALLEEKKSNTHLQNEGRHQQLRINELEKKLKSALEERDDARGRMDSFDTREEDLYKKLRESDRIRRDLHNRVMQLSGNIRVYVRVRPPLPGETEKQQADPGKAEGSRKRKVAEIVEEENHFHFPGVYDRASPSSQEEQSSSSADDLTKNLIEVTEPYKDRGGLKDRRKKWRFGFDHIFRPNQGQEDVWEATEPLVQSAIDGYNVCIFAYGQTGKPCKTYSLSYLVM
jgi:chromosome segregation ATPase